MSDYINHNGNIIRSDKAVITAENRGFRYGDGLFETIKIKHGQLQLGAYHFERLFGGLASLQFDKPGYFDADYLAQQVTALCKKNGHEKAARVRLMVFRGNGGLYDPENHFPNYIIQSWALPAGQVGFNENGLVIDLYPEARKSIDAFSSLKCNNYLPYLMAALHAKQQQLNDCLVLNSKDRICDSSIANVFIIKKGVIITPSLSEGCVAGVMRRYLLEKLQELQYNVQQSQLTPEDLQQADEVFLTNAMYGIRWVQRFNNVTYNNTMTAGIYARIIKTLTP